MKKFSILLLLALLVSCGLEGVGSRLLSGHDGQEEQEQVKVFFKQLLSKCYLVGSLFSNFRRGSFYLYL